MSLVEFLADALREPLEQLGVDPDAPAPDVAHSVDVWLAWAAVTATADYRRAIAVQDMP